MSQRALMVTEIGKPMVVTHRPIPTPQEGEILVKVLIAGLNPHDAASRSRGLFINDSLPTPLATDIVGTVVTLGPGVLAFNVGDTVFGFGDPQLPDQLGTQEYCVLAVAQTAHVPENVSLDEAATLPLNPMTSFFALFHPQGLDIPPPFPDQTTASFDYGAQSLVIIGAGSATGKFALQLAKFAGIGRIIAVASKTNDALLRSLGATAVVDRHLGPDEVEAQVRGMVGDELVYALDCVGRGPGGQTLGARMLSRTRRGVLAVLVGAGSVDERALTGSAAKQAGYERRFVLCQTKKYIDTSAPFWRVLPRWVEQGVLSPTPFEVYGGGFADVQRVNAALDGYAAGRNVTRPNIHF